MSAAGLRKRTTCAACLDTCRVTPSEIAWREKSDAAASWLYATRDLCRPCRRVQKDFWFRRPAAARRATQLRLLSDVEAPLRAVELGESRLSRADLEDLATVRQQLRAPAGQRGQVG